jgi:hypothetical protein
MTMTALTDPGMARSYLVRSIGWYTIHVPPAARPRAVLGQPYLDT